MLKLIKKILKHTFFYSLYTKKIAPRRLYAKKRKEYYNKPRLEVVKNDFYARMGYYPDFDNPKTLNEKMSWLKVFWYDPLVHLCADKWSARMYVKSVLGNEDILTKRYAFWNDPSKIKLDNLPDKFILKGNHGCGGNVICRDKSTFNLKNAKKVLKSKFNREYAVYSQEWGYEGIKPRVLCEELLEPKDGRLLDYKIFCSGGKAKFLYVSETVNHDDGAKEETLNYYDTNFNQIPCTQTFANIKGKVEKPKNFEKMIEYAEKLSKAFPIVRVDFFNVDGKIYFAEFTFFSYSGATKITPEIYDEKLGAMLDLPPKQETPFNYEK